MTGEITKDFHLIYVVIRHKISMNVKLIKRAQVLTISTIFAVLPAKHSANFENSIHLQQISLDQSEHYLIQTSVDILNIKIRIKFTFKFWEN